MKQCLLCAALASGLAALAQAGGKPADGPQADAPDFVFLGDTRPVLIRVHVHIDGKPLRAAWEECIRHLFQYLDVNGDGVLDREEAARIPPRSLLFPSRAPDVTVPPFVLLDTNRDGKVSHAELADYYRRSGGAPWQVDAVANPEPRFRKDSGFPQGQGVRVRIRRLHPGQQGEALTEALFQILDTNKDGKLSRAELAAGAARLRELDADDDEMLDARELLGAAFPGGPGTVPEGAMPPGGASSAGPAFLTLAPGASTKPLARELQARYGARGGKQGSKKLTRKDIGLDQATFDRLDVDEDGTLDAEELARFAQRPADLELVVRFGKAPAKGEITLSGAKGRAAPLAMSVRAANDGSLLLDLGTTRLRLRCRAAVPVERLTAALREDYLAVFRALDADNNGYLDRNEVRRSAPFRELFALLDRDGDGKVFEKELLAYLDALRPLQARALTGCASLTFAEQSRGLFGLLDTNRDGRLSVRELRQLVKLADQFDRDGDGQISRDEIPRTYQAMVAQGPATLARPGRGATSPDGPVPPLAGPLWFRKMDRNRDGDVSRREFLGTGEEFRRIDTDGDGLISVAEAERADAVLRQPGPK